MEAIELLNKEIQASPNDGMLAAVGERYIDIVAGRQDVAELICAGYAGGKTLKQMINKSKEHFRGRAVGGCAAVRNDEAERFFDEYWGVTAAPQTSRRREVSLEAFL